MREYVTPRMTGETFAANEYIAACWGVACITNEANQWEIDHNNYHGGDISHQDDHCGLKTNQAIRTDSFNTPISMTEVGTDGLGSLPCTLYDSPTYARYDQIDISTVSPGDKIYWTTSSGSRTWHHVGIVEETYPGHPNRS